jgi:hypothetical protein
MKPEDIRLESAQAVAEELQQATKHISKAIALMEYHNLNLENYPEYWHDFAEHPDELRSMFVTDFKDIQVQVGGNNQ